MHHLDRSGPLCPSCLTRYHHGRDNWNSLDPIHRQEICAALEVVQGKRCAYCEGDLDVLGSHIEHFQQRSRYPRGTFEWDNLFWSCNCEDSCGKHKDTCGKYDPRMLIKPDVENPEQYLLFVTDGSIAIRSSLSEADRCRARETLRILNLDAVHGRLRKMRQRAAVGFVRTAEEIRELACQYPPDIWMPFLVDELTQIQSLPFSTTIKHVLTPQGAM